MTLPSVTYQTIITQVANYVANNCQNIGSKYNSLSSYLKTGTTQQVFKAVCRWQVTKDKKHKTADGKTFNIKVKTGVPNKSTWTATNVENELKTFLDAYDLKNGQYNYYIDRANLYNLIYNIALFCQHKICWAVYTFPGNYGTFNGDERADKIKKKHNTFTRGKCLIYSNTAVSSITNGKKLTPTSANPNSTNNFVLASTITQIIDQILSNRLATKHIKVEYKIY